jgi:hypothetical protein
LWIKHSGKQSKKDRKVALPARFTAVYTQYLDSIGKFIFWSSKAPMNQG